MWTSRQRRPGVRPSGLLFTSLGSSRSRVSASGSGPSWSLCGVGEGSPLLALLKELRIERAFVHAAVQADVAIFSTKVQFSPGTPLSSGFAGSGKCKLTPFRPEIRPARQGLNSSCGCGPSAGALGAPAPARCELCPRRVYGRRHLSTPVEVTSGIELGPLGGARLRMSGSFPEAKRGTSVVGGHALGLCPGDWTFVQSCGLGQPIRNGAGSALTAAVFIAGAYQGLGSRSAENRVSTLRSVWADAGQGRGISCFPAFPVQKAT